ncbi:HdaA/DnaA family protein [Conchiformibius kuhniae]|uniref:DnaA ATPase domain-containing protein n=1 Tax=Conchiformibius kuhniae TaxID=211502 RepID=A0A8T9MSN6_9NEIS|nr:DnaA/Hda family protein [Conchiformibius kuhniae]UOP04291.1 DnaA/Hda family protein [Conchiformibius kuhniae]
MNQLSLDFAEPIYPRFDKLLGTANAELIYILQQEYDQFIYLWGERGSGKSHILQAWVGQALQNGHEAVYIDAAAYTLTESFIAEARYIAIDQIEKLRSREQAVLFNVFNRFRNSRQGHLLLSSDLHPSRLNLREDLRTRVAYCLPYEVKALSFQEKIDALTNMAHVRCLNIDPRIYPYLLEHWQQDMDSLLQMFDDLANYSILSGKPMTLALLKQLLKEDKETSFA